MLKSKLSFHSGLPTPTQIQKSLGVEHLVCIYDNQLLNYPQLAEWLATFSHGFSVTAGEALKELKNFPALIETIHHGVQGFGPGQIGVVAVGGGTVGDAMGFLASVLKRGVPFFSVPSTWLAAMDSAHGGKTGLNLGPYKNQVGTYYPANEIWISKTLLVTQSDFQLQSALGELAKMALLCGGSMFKRLTTAKKIDADLLWKMLPEVTAAKNRIVQKDPYEKKGFRYALNLGHTLGHALELNHQLTHGEAVRLGLWFASVWSLQRGYLKNPEYKRFTKILGQPPQSQHQMTKARVADALKHDKKISTQNKINFVFLEKPGRHRIERVSIDEILTECERQGWIR